MSGPISDVIAIDPGIVSGVAVFVGRRMLLTDTIKVSDPTAAISYLQDLLDKHGCVGGFVAVIEDQFFRRDGRPAPGSILKLAEISGWWRAALAMAGVEVVARPQPRTWQSAYGIGKKRGKKGHFGLIPGDDTKAQSLNLVRLHPDLQLQDVSDHEADAALMGLWLINEKRRVAA